MAEQFRAMIAQKAVTDEGHGEISGLASFYGNVDLQDDVMEPGALNKTVADWMAPGTRAKVPLLDAHDYGVTSVIGSVGRMKAQGPGLWWKAAFAGTEKAQAARQLAKDGHLGGVSIGYLPIRQSFQTDPDGKTIRHLHEVKLLEISLTPVPANPLAQVDRASVKDMTDTQISDLAGLDFGAFTEAMASALAIGYAPARKAAVDLLIKAYHLDSTGTAPEGIPAVAAEQGTAEGTTADPLSYAAKFLNPGPRDGAPGGQPPLALAGALGPVAVAQETEAMDRLEAELRAQLGDSGADHERAYQATDGAVT